MSLSSVTFLVAILIVGGFFFFLPAGQARRFFLAVCNILFLATWVHNGVSWICLAGFVLSGYAAARLIPLIRTDEGRAD